jgi:hypothetical protein
MDFKDFDMAALMLEGESGIDSFLSDAPKPQRKASSEVPSRIRVASVKDLVGFNRIASDTLIRKSERDLWKLRQSEDGQWVIDRLFDDDGNPLKA